MPTLAARKQIDFDYESETLESSRQKRRRALQHILNGPPLRIRLRVAPVCLPRREQGAVDPTTREDDAGSSAASEDEGWMESAEVDMGVREVPEIMTGMEVALARLELQEGDEDDRRLNGVSSPARDEHLLPVSRMQAVSPLPRMLDTLTTAEGSDDCSSPDRQSPLPPPPISAHSSPYERSEWPKSPGATPSPPPWSPTPSPIPSVILAKSPGATPSPPPCSGSHSPIPTKSLYATESHARPPVLHSQMATSYLRPERSSTPIQPLGAMDPQRQGPPADESPSRAALTTGDKGQFLAGVGGKSIQATIEDQFAASAFSLAGSPPGIKYSPRASNASRRVALKSGTHDGRQETVSRRCELTCTSGVGGKSIQATIEDQFAASAFSLAGSPPGIKYSPRASNASRRVALKSGTHDGRRETVSRRCELTCTSGVGGKSI
ncbi:hypothetical protein CALCODRAFT_534215 [Calocera cornea HHB12733]|uniref:Uncharacterized protein n=1 Tax=Calocera cornea HHB12733 TaxID=1353952 RepID=A0A165I3A8_9BASI|nr:hypothetical protein CALCODRAFT_534215 [Calocera cornea HHB12733]